MKLKSYDTLFRAFSFLSDKTNGAPFFVKYKLLLGTIIIGLGATSCGTKPSSEITCYDMSTTEGDSLNVGVDIDTPVYPDMLITCYDVSIFSPDEESNKTDE